MVADEASYHFFVCHSRPAVVLAMRVIACLTESQLDNRYDKTFTSRMHSFHFLLGHDDEIGQYCVDSVPLVDSFSLFLA